MIESAGPAESCPAESSSTPAIAFAHITGSLCSIAYRNLFSSVPLPGIGCDIKDKLSVLMRQRILIATLYRDEFDPLGPFLPIPHHRERMGRVLSTYLS